MRDKFDKRYYKIGEVAEMLGIPPSTLRYWESRFTLLSPGRNAAGLRRYTPDDVETIRVLYYLVKEQGLKLSAAEDRLRANRGAVSRRFLALERLRMVRSRLAGLLDAVNSIR